MTTNTASETLTEVRRSLKPPNGALSNDEQPKPLSDNDIAIRAYFLWESRGRPVGCRRCSCLGCGPRSGTIIFRWTSRASSTSGCCSPETDWFRAQEEQAAWRGHPELEAI